MLTSSRPTASDAARTSPHSDDEILDDDDDQQPPPDGPPDGRHPAPTPRCPASTVLLFSTAKAMLPALLRPLPYPVDLRSRDLSISPPEDTLAARQRHQLRMRLLHLCPTKRARTAKTWMMTRLSTPRAMVLKIRRRRRLQLTDQERHQGRLLPRPVCIPASARWRAKRLNKSGHALTGPRPSATPYHRQFTSLFGHRRPLKLLLNEGHALTEARPSATDHDHRPLQLGRHHMELPRNMGSWLMFWMRR